MRIASLALFVFALIGAAALEAARNVDVPLGVSYRNDPYDGVTSDGQLSLGGLPFQYVNGLPDNIGAVLKGGGNLIYTAQYDPKTPIRRALCINFGTQVSPLGAQVLCPAANQNMDPPLDNLTASTPLSAMHYGDSVMKRMQVWWDNASAGYRYHVRYGGDMNGDGVADAPPITVVCIAPTNAAEPCAQWNVDAGAYTIVGRSKLLKGGQLGSFEFLGLYDLPFEITLTRQ
jgi:hypothetical protein